MAIFDYEHRSTQKTEGGWRLFKIGMITLYVVYTLAYLAVVFKTVFYALGAILPLTLWILIHYTWRYVNPDYLYNIDSGVIKFTIIYGNKVKKLKVSVKLCEAIEIAPMSACENLIRDLKPKKIYNALPCKNCENPYAIIFKNDAGDISVLYIPTTEQAVRALRFYNPKTK